MFYDKKRIGLMNDPNEEEVRFVTDAGTVVVRAWRNTRNAWLGLSLGRNTEDEPDIVVDLGPKLRHRVAEALVELGGIDEVK